MNIADHEERISILKSLINEYNTLYSNTPAILSPERHNFVLICIICRINDLLSPYIKSLSSESCIEWYADNSFIFKTIQMVRIIKKQIGVESDEKLFELMKAKQELLAGQELLTNSQRAVVLSPVPVKEKIVGVKSINVHANVTVLSRSQSLSSVITRADNNSNAKKSHGRRQNSNLNVNAREFVPRPICTSV